MTRKLTKDELTTIVKTFGHMTEKPYSEDFCWEADVGNRVSPLGFAAYVAVYGDDLATDLQKEAEHHITDELFSAFLHETQNRKFDDVVNDILRNIAHDAIDELEGYHETEEDEGVES